MRAVWIDIFSVKQVYGLGCSVLIHCLDLAFSDGRSGAKSPLGNKNSGELVMNKRESMLMYHNVVRQRGTKENKTFYTLIL